METYKCCICGKVETGFGNNPFGAVDENKKVIQWKGEDRCCDECNRRYILPGRIFNFYKVIRPECLVKKQDK